MKTDFTYNSILCAVDFSDCSRKAFYVAVRYAALFDADLTLMHVREQAITVEGLEQNEERVVRLEEGIRRRLSVRGDEEALESRDRFVDRVPVGAVGPAIPGVPDPGARALGTNRGGLWLGPRSPR